MKDCFFWRSVCVVQYANCIGSSVGGSCHLIWPKTSHSKGLHDDWRERNWEVESVSSDTAAYVHCHNNNDYKFLWQIIWFTIKYHVFHQWWTLFGYRNSVCTPSCVHINPQTVSWILPALVASVSTQQSHMLSCADLCSLRWLRLLSREQTFASIVDGMPGLAGLAFRLDYMVPHLPCFCFVLQRSSVELLLFHWEVIIQFVSFTCAHLTNITITEQKHTMYMVQISACDSFGWKKNPKNLPVTGCSEHLHASNVPYQEVLSGYATSCVCALCFCCFFWKPNSVKENVKQLVNIWKFVWLVVGQGQGLGVGMPVFNYSVVQWYVIWDCVCVRMCACVLSELPFQREWTFSHLAWLDPVHMKVNFTHTQMIWGSFSNGN